jgi:hypothetical protein
VGVVLATVAQEERMTMDLEREVARCNGIDVGSDDHGGLMLVGVFEYAGAGQGLGYRIDTDFLRRFMAVFRVERLRDVNGRACWVTHDNCSVRLIEPLLPAEGTPFDVVAWSEAHKRATP